MVVGGRSFPPLATPLSRNWAVTEEYTETRYRSHTLETKARVDGEGRSSLEGARGSDCNGSEPSVEVPQSVRILHPRWSVGLAAVPNLGRAAGRLRKRYPDENRE